jgi:hypothetical protein
MERLVLSKADVHILFLSFLLPVMVFLAAALMFLNRFQPVFSPSPPRITQSTPRPEIRFRSTPPRKVKPRPPAPSRR